MIMGFAGVTWAMSVNKFLAATVRIQTDRGQRVIETGPYANGRHPGYAIGHPLFLGMPLLWARCGL
jgi:protein-S-isoprenylcysteine O-methyltransferase Ste14